MFELDSGIISSKLPVYSLLSGIPVSVPFIQLRIQIIQIINSTFPEALLGQRWQFNLSNIKPTSMLESIMEFESFGESQCFSQRESLIERTLVMGIEIVTYHDNLFCIRVDFVCKPFHLLGPIRPGPVLQCLRMAIAGKRLRKKKYTAGSSADVFTVLDEGTILLRRPWRASANNCRGLVFQKYPLKRVES